MATMIFPATWKLTSLRIQPSSPSSASRNLKPPHCSPIQQEQTVDVAIMCQPCNGRGWLLCDFCKGQKTNVKSETNRIYRRCPSCRAIGQVLCSKCKVFKCVTFPNYDDGEEVSFVTAVCARICGLIKFGDACGVDASASGINPLVLERLTIASSLCISY